MTSQLITAPAIERYASRRVCGQRPMRVLTLTPFYPAAEDSTQGRFISEPLDYVKTEEVAVKTIAVQSFYREGRRTAVDKTTTWVRYFRAPGNFGLPTAGTLLEQRLVNTVTEEHRRDPFSLIHAHAALPCGHAAMLLSERLSIPYVVSVHGLDAYFTRQAGPLVGPWCRAVSAKVYRSARTVICISEKVRDQVTAGTEANTNVIYNGVDTEAFSPGPARDLPPAILAVGNLISTKGHATLLRAFRRVLNSIPDCTLDVIGDGPEHKKLTDLASQLNVSGQVHFRGRQGKRYVADAMRRCSVFALPSAYEGLGCVYLEAMACAKLVIGCYGQGIDEIIRDGKTGILVPPANESDLANALTTLLHNRGLRYEIGTAARELVMQRFTLQHQAKKLAETYRRCAS